MSNWKIVMESWDFPPVFYLRVKNGINDSQHFLCVGWNADFALIAVDFVPHGRAISTFELSGQGVHKSNWQYSTDRKRWKKCTIKR